MISRRCNRLGGLLGLLAVLCQMILPSVHAQQWATRAGDPALSAFCGELSPTLIKKLGERFPDALAPAHSEHSSNALLSCPWCVALHANHLGTAPIILLSITANLQLYCSAARLPAAPQVRLVYLPNLRGPPPV